MEIFLQSHVFTAVANFILTFWNDPTGRIFLVTFLAYAASYMVYSGYISWFTGGYGSFSLSQAGFTAIDFLALVPMVFILLFESVVPFLKSIGKIVFWNIFLPFSIFIIIVFFRGSFRVFPEGNTAFLGISYVSLLGAFICVALIPFTNKSNRLFSKLSTGAIWVSLIVMAFSIPIAPARSGVSSTAQSVDIPNVVSPIAMFAVEIVACIALLVIIMLPLALGLFLASFAVREGFLSKVVKIDLNRPVTIATAKLSVNKDVHTYTFSDDFPVYLISTFARNTALYLPQKNAHMERSNMLLVSNDLICSIELEGRKKQSEANKTTK